MAHDVGLARDARVFAFDPIILDRDFRRDEIGAYGAATQRQRQANRRNLDKQGRRALKLSMTAHQYAPLSVEGRRAALSFQNVSRESGQRRHP
jgi:hypothetical protein